MPKTNYTPEFERIWKAYPMWPKGRSVKQLAFKKFQSLKKQLGWDDDDVQEILDAIEEQKVHRDTWQRGNQYGPQALQTWLNQFGWEHDYGEKKKGVAGRGGGSEPWELRNMSRAEYDAEQDWLGRDQLGLQQDYPTKEDAIAAAALRELGNGPRH